MTQVLQTKPMTPEKVIVMQTAYVGDVVFTSPLVRAIKESWPETSVTLLVQPSYREVAECIPGVSQVITFDKRKRESGFLGLLKVGMKIKKERFDLLVSPHRSHRSALLAKLSGIPVRVGYERGLGRLCYQLKRKHLTGEFPSIAYDLKLLEKVGIQSASTYLKINAPEDRKPYIEELFRRNRLTDDVKLVGLCIGAHWPTKRWPPVYFASLSESLIERGYQPIMLGGPNEHNIASAIEELLKMPLLSCVGNSFSESAVLLHQCKMVVGGDSGLTHMARALGVPTVLIFGPTDHRIHTFSERNKVLTAKVKCRPCSHHGPRRCPEQHHDCMRLISPEEVLQALKDISNLQTPISSVRRKPQAENFDSSSTVD